jgi:hypothetical protein
MKKLSLSVLVLSLVSLSALAQSTEHKSVPAANSSTPSRLSMNVTVAKQTPNTSFGEKVNAGLATGTSSAVAIPGQPIGGIVVKGGQNPTQGMTEDHRTYTGGRRNEAAAAAITPATTADKSISEKGIKRTSN